MPSAITPARFTRRAASLRERSDLVHVIVPRQRGSTWSMNADKGEQRRHSVTARVPGGVREGEAIEAEDSPLCSEAVVPGDPPSKSGEGGAGEAVRGGFAWTSAPPLRLASPRGRTGLPGQGGRGRRRNEGRGGWTD
jgi:hypothetical protein